MNDIIFEALKLLIMVCVAVIARYVIPWLKSRIEQDKMAAIEKDGYTGRTIRAAGTHIKEWSREKSYCY